MSGVIDGDEASRLVWAGPGEGHQGVPCPVAVPRGPASKKLPVAVAEGRVPQAFQGGDAGTSDLDRPATEVEGDAHPLPLVLALVEEAEGIRRATS